MYSYPESNYFENRFYNMWKPFNYNNATREIVGVSMFRTAKLL